MPLEGQRILKGEWLIWFRFTYFITGSFLIVQCGHNCFLASSDLTRWNPQKANISFRNNQDPGHVLDLHSYSYKMTSPSTTILILFLLSKKKKPNTRVKRSLISYKAHSFLPRLNVHMSVVLDVHMSLSADVIYSSFQNSHVPRSMPLPLYFRPTTNWMLCTGVCKNGIWK